ncbi:hypothetical protein Tco_1333826 [Tanacetum coccineum]
MSSYSIPHGSTRASSSSTCSTIQINREMQQLCGVAEYSLLSECKIVVLILLNHCLSHAQAATADVPAVYLQQFWRTVSKVPDIEDTIKFMLDTQQFTYTMDMFRDTLHLPVETLENPFVAPANINTIETFMNRVGYQGVVDKKFPNISKRIDEDYHSIKDDIPLVSVYTTGNVSVQGMLIPDAFLTAEIQETNDFKESPTISASPPVSKKRKQIAGESSSPRKSLKITITQNQIVEKDDDDSEDRIEPESHKDNPEVVDDDDNKERKTKDDEMGSLEIRNEETQIIIPTPLSSPRKILSSDKKTSQELTDIVSNPTTTTSKHSQVKKRISSKYSHFPGALRRMCRRQGYMIQDMERKCVTTVKFLETHNKIDDILHKIVPQIELKEERSQKDQSLQEALRQSI